MYRLVRNLYILAFIMIIVFVSGWFYNYHGTNRQLQETAQKSTELSVYLQSKKISRLTVTPERPVHKRLLSVLSDLVKIIFTPSGNPKRQEMCHENQIV